MKNKNLKGYLITIGLVLLLFSIMLINNKVYPFGSNIFSFIDFDEGYIPTYYKLWDILHLKSNMLFDWNLGAGLNCFGSLIMNGFVSPLCWIIALFKRDYIPYAMTFIMAIKFIFIASVTYYSIGKIMPKTKISYKIMGTLLYTFSAYMLLMCSNILYLDAIGLFPLLFYFLIELINKGKWKGFLFTLSYILMLSFYQGYMNLFFIICFTTAYLLIFEVENKKTKLIKVVFFTLFSLFISSIVFLPSFYQTMTSYRMSTNYSNNTGFDYILFMEKAVYLFTLAIPFVCIFKQLLVKKDKKINRFIMIVLFLLLIGVVIEPINALWHTGSHSGFPFRYGHIPTFFMIMSSLYYLNNNYKIKKDNKNIALIGSILMIGIFAIISYFISNNIRGVIAYQINKYTEFFGPLFMFLILVFIVTFILKMNNKKVIYILIIVTVVQSISFSSIYLKNSDTNTSITMQDLQNKFDLPNDGYNYMINIDNTNINFPYILNRPSISNRLHFIKEDELNLSKAFGYKTVDTMIYSNGGNAFSDLLLQNKYYITTKKKNNKIYELINSKDGINLYKSKYNLNYVVPYNGKIYNEDKKDSFVNTNSIYNDLFDNEGYLFDEIEYNYENNKLSFELEKDKIYYATFSTKNDELISLKYNINDLNVNIIGTSNPDSINYSLEFSYDENTNVSLDFNVLLYDIKIYEFDINSIEKFAKDHQLDCNVSTNKNKKIYDLNIDYDSDILIPINYDDNMLIKVNGKEVKYEKNLFNMYSIKVKKGHNKIEMIYYPKFYKEGILITVAGFIVLGILYLINKKTKFIYNKYFVYPVFIIDILLFILFYLKVYIMSWL